MRVYILSQKADEPFISPYIPSLGIKAYDEDNLYPQNVARIVGDSPTGGTCVNRYASFIEGNGIVDQSLSRYIVNRRGETIDDIHTKASKDLALFGGIALHVNYNILGEAVELNHVPFENVRLCEDDSAGYISRCAVFWDWSGRTSRNGTYEQPNEKNVSYIDVFNPRKEVVLAQIERDGIENYKGQILYITPDGVNTYPVPKCAPVLTEMSTDQGLTTFRNRITRYGFYAGGMVFVPKGASEPAENDGPEDKRGGFVEALQQMQGDENVGRLMGVEVDGIERPEFVSFESPNYDKALTETNQSVVDRIYAAYDQDPFYSIRMGKVGFSGTMINDAEMYYSRLVTKEQRLLTRAYRMIFNAWFSDTLRSASDEQIQIEPLIKSVNETSDNV